LENRLRAELGGTGSELYALKWKKCDMSSGPQICALRASVRRTSVNDSSSSESRKVGWKTPVVNDSMGSTYTYSGGDHSKIVWKLPGEAKLADWGLMDSTQGMLVSKNPDSQGGSGPIQTGSGVGAKRSAQLNAAHSLWLMGLPDTWLFAAPARRIRTMKRSTPITESVPSKE
jgi:hypothetical protein